MPIVKITIDGTALLSLDTEEYVKGCLAAEMPASWHEQALKAQSDVIRGYGLAKMAERGFVYADTRDQVFDPSKRTTRTDAIVDATRGVVGLYQGKIVPTWYHASCGGKTLGDWGAWLRVAECPCGRAKHGHRRGLCQYGARALAEQGESWRGILDFYYKDMEWVGDYGRRATMNTKTSLHWQTLKGWSQQVMADWRPVWVKVMDPPETGVDPFPEIRHKDIRFHTDGWDDPYVARGVQGGRDYIQELLPRILACPWADGIEVTNERECNKEPQISYLRDFSIGAMRELSKHGKRGIIFNWPEASPHNNDLPGLEHTIWKMTLFLPAVIEAVETGHIIGRHYYWRPEVEGPLGRHHALGRVEWDVLWWGEQGVDIDKLQVLATESGIDGGIAHKPGVEGWQTMVAKGLVTRDEYIAQIVEAEGRAQQLPWLRGMFLFNAGSLHPWGSYDHDERMTREVIGALRAIQPTPPPSILPESETARDAATLVEKCRWWHEEYIRQVEAGNIERARDIRYSLPGLMYRAEQAVKEAT